MITIKARDFKYNGNKDRIEGECLSTDTKPTIYANGSILLEMDTAKFYAFDEANSEWLEVTGE